jgi:anti-repressor protein
MTKDIIAISQVRLSGATTNGVNSRDIHEYVESKQDYSTWIKKRLEQLGAVEGEDFLTLHKKMERQKLIDYIITTDIAKHLGMMERNYRGKEIRDYFIEIEKKHAEIKLPDFTNPAESARAWAEQYELREKALAQIEADRPRVSFAQSVEASVDSVLIGNYAKLLSDAEGIKIGQNKLFEWLRDNGYLISHGNRRNVPYQKYVDNGYFEVTTQTFAGSTGTHQRFTTRITGRGQVALAKKIVDVMRDER